MKHITYKLEDGTPVYIEAEEVEKPKGSKLVSGKKDKEGVEAKRFENALVNIKPAAESVLQTFREMNTPDEITLDFSLKFKADIGAVFASTGTQAIFRVTLKWKNDKSADGDAPLAPIVPPPDTSGKGVTNE
ncbi:MAG: hypothetical protein KAI83_11700 [Thiomargarita sp.]|nr:hypothetical protein [Thiomargarita sp.]